MSPAAAYRTVDPAATMTKRLVVFPADDCGWQSDDWTASDDRVRGGKSQSHLCCEQDTARFWGTLDIETLGGAGFASQRTTSDDLELDLSDYVGITLSIKEGDKNRYTFILKDDVPPPDEKTGREQSSISYECDFELPPDDETGEDDEDISIFIPWDAFTPTYRGKPKKEADPLDLKNIKRINIMIRSFFGAQKGDFSLTLKSISAACQAPPPIIRPARPTKHVEVDARRLEDGPPSAEPVLWKDSSALSNGRRRSVYAVLLVAAITLLYFRGFGCGLWR